MCLLLGNCQFCVFVFRLVARRIFSNQFWKSRLPKKRLLQSKRNQQSTQRSDYIVNETKSNLCSVWWSCFQSISRLIWDDCSLCTIRSIDKCQSVTMTTVEARSDQIISKKQTEFFLVNHSYLPFWNVLLFDKLERINYDGILFCFWNTSKIESRVDFLSEVEQSYRSFFNGISIRYRNIQIKKKN